MGLDGLDVLPARTLRSERVDPDLVPVELDLDVVRLVVDGRSNDEIAVRLGIGPKTVESHLRRLFERFDLASRTELATRALREGWLEVPPA